jgi:hypothetical protein
MTTSRITSRFNALVARARVARGVVAGALTPRSWHSPYRGRLTPACEGLDGLHPRPRRRCGSDSTSVRGSNRPGPRAEGRGRLVSHMGTPDDPDPRRPARHATRIAGPGAGGRRANATRRRSRFTPLGEDRPRPTSRPTSARNANNKTRHPSGRNIGLAPRPAPHDVSLGRSATRPGSGRNGRPQVVGVVDLRQAYNDTNDSAKSTVSVRPAD